jgi:hypothetical protein
MKKCQGFVRQHVCAIVTVLFLACPSCREEKPNFEIISLDGKIEKIDRASDETGEITVSYYSEKQKAEVVGVGLVSKSTEIMINGAIAALKDIREGERVRGEVRVEKKGGERVQTVLKIYVTRATAPSEKEGG